MADEFAGIPHPSRLGQVDSELRGTFVCGRHAANDFDAVLFDQELADLRDLPSAILGKREPAVSCDAVRDPGFCMSRFNGRLVHAIEDIQLIQAVEKALTTAGLALSISDHSASFRVLNCSADSLSMRECVNLLMQTLLFNARELQANIALVRQAMAHPVAGLLDKTDVAIRINAVQSIFKPMRTDAGQHFSNYRSPAMRRTERRERLQSRLPGQPIPPIATPEGTVS
ncbi:hypothetical protein P8R33_12680 [Qipengyuania sp. XHP0211]|uniref:hypothetical protein n=1 Tax=Qipengyuania sp. XHP0211 TaxID=3038079 RepID=UPI00241DD015|nr:hypothetical protein [Qipengyuania sp. XHP0211]MDG5751965.1 hypothetical protein [Qipengyuania sp. XHP0211]